FAVPVPKSELPVPVSFRFGYVAEFRLRIGMATLVRFVPRVDADALSEITIKLEGGALAAVTAEAVLIRMPMFSQPVSSFLMASSPAVKVVESVTRRASGIGVAHLTAASNSAQPLELNTPDAMAAADANHPTLRAGATNDWAMLAPAW